jgi:glycosyltransferase involved in cell wall biosynthesis
MKVLYAAWRYDPRSIDQASGVDFQVYQALLRNGHEVKIVNPIQLQPVLSERLIRRLLRAVHRKYLKYDWSLVWRASKKLNKYAAIERADVIFTLFPPSLVFYNQQTPVVYNVDNTFYSWQKEMGELESWAFNISVLQEKMALKNCSRIITYSDWSKNDLVEFYNVAPEKVDIVVVPASLPERVVPKNIDVKVEKRLIFPIHLLLVGREFKRKGVDIAIETVRILNSQNIPAELVVCGTSGPPSPYTRFVGPYKKGDDVELREYISWYRWAHLLIHPALFEGAGIVPSEAAAFAVPTITNAVSALSTTVKHGVSGIVLPKRSPAEAYAEAIKSLIQDPQRYYALCESSRLRYEQELNWEVAGKKFIDALSNAIKR